MMKKHNHFLILSKHLQQCKYKIDLSSKNGKDIIYIQPIGNMKEQKEAKFKIPSPPSLEILVEYTKLFFSSGQGNIRDVILLPSLDLTQKKSCYYLGDIKIDSRKGLDHDEDQLYIDDLANVLKTKVPDDAYTMVGVVMFDLYMSKKDLFLSGFNYVGKRCSIFSFARYDPYYLERSEESDYHTDLIYFDEIIQDEKFRKELTLRRSLKTISHEILHSLGFGHCIYFKCLMNGTGNIKEDDQAPFNLCCVCLKKLQHSLKMDVIERYQKMKEFFEKLEFKNESEWFEKRIEFIRGKKRKFEE